MKLLSIDELKPVKGIPYSKPHLWRLIRAGKFPRPIRLGENRIAFPEHEIDAFLESRLAERDAVTETQSGVIAGLAKQSKTRRLAQLSENAGAA